MFLLIDNGEERKLAPYAERYILSDNLETIIEIVLERGWESFLDPPHDIRPGFAESFMCGEVNLQIFNLEPKP